MQHSEKETEQVSAVFKALSNPVRLRILSIISETKRPLHIKAVAKNLKMDYAAVYRHVRVLKEAGVLQIYDVGRSRVLSPLHIDELGKLLELARHVKR